MGFLLSVQFTILSAFRLLVADGCCQSFFHKPLPHASYRKQPHLRGLGNPFVASPQPLPQLVGLESHSRPS